MTDTQLQKLKSDALETFKSINFDKLTKDGFILAGAVMGILNHEKEKEVNIPVQVDATIVADNIEVVDKVDRLPNSSVDEHIDELNDATIEFWKATDEFEKYRTQKSKDEMIESLENLLKEFEDVVQEIRIKCQYSECLELFKDFYESLGRKI